MRALLLILLLALAPPGFAETRDAEKHFFQTKMGDLSTELDTVRSEGKKGVLLFFEMDDCPWCARMKATVLNQPEVQDYFRKHFLIYSIDVNGDVPLTDFQGKATTEKAFAFENRVRATPTMLFFGPDGKLLTRYTGPTKNIEEMLLLGRYVVDDAYRQMPFAKYKQNAGELRPGGTPK